MREKNQIDLNWKVCFFVSLLYIYPVNKKLSMQFYGLFGFKFGELNAMQVNIKGLLYVGRLQMTVYTRVRYYFWKENAKIRSKRAGSGLFWFKNAYKNNKKLSKEAGSGLLYWIIIAKTTKIDQNSPNPSFFYSKIPTKSDQKKPDPAVLFKNTYKR